MKIAQIAPLAESCPPKLYGGTERVVSSTSARTGSPIALSQVSNKIFETKVWTIAHKYRADGPTWID